MSAKRREPPGPFEPYVVAVQRPGRVVRSFVGCRSERMARQLVRRMAGQGIGATISGQPVATEGER